MAILESKGGDLNRSYEISKLCPTGVYPARCIDILDSMDVEEPSFDDPTVMVTKNKTKFLFSVKAGEETELVQTFEFNISGSPKSSLWKFIKAWLGKAPAPAFDTLNLIGQACQLTIDNRTSKKGTAYATVESIAPLMDPSQAPAVDAVEVPGGPRADITVETPSTPASDGNGNAGSQKDPF